MLWIYSVSQATVNDFHLGSSMERAFIVPDRSPAPGSVAAMVNLCNVVQKRPQNCFIQVSSNSTITTLALFSHLRYDNIRGLLHYGSSLPAVSTCSFFLLKADQTSQKPGTRSTQLSCVREQDGMHFPEAKGWLLKADFQEHVLTDDVARWALVCYLPAQETKV